jgi:NAD(P)H-hydrate epimerase
VTIVPASRGRAWPWIAKADLIIDALFGIGLTAAVREPYGSMIRTVNLSKIPVLAVDVPSGLNADTGEIMGTAVKAARTVTFVAVKRGCLGHRCCGRIIVRDIGLAYNEGR